MEPTSGGANSTEEHEVCELHSAQHEEEQTEEPTSSDSASGTRELIHGRSICEPRREKSPVERIQVQEDRSSELAGTGRRDRELRPDRMRKSDRRTCR
jgi:hypothetical protein